MAPGNGDKCISHSDVIGGLQACFNHILLSESLKDLLSKYSHLDLTNEVVLVDEVIRGCGGYSDVYFGRLSKTGKYVAVKQLRVHIQREEQLSKASTLCFRVSHFKQIC
jgi:hypothetical protein